MGHRALRWAVIGGGMLGLTLAWRLARAGHSVSLFEASTRIGGLAGAWRLGGVTWDRYYHVILQTDLHLRGLLAELGLEKDIRWRRTRTGFFNKGKLHELSDVMDFIRFEPLTPWQRLRVGMTVHRASRWKGVKALERTTAVRWLRAWSGEGALRALWLPLLRSKLGPNAERVAATFMWATFVRLYSARRSGMKEERFGYHPGGYAGILQRFSERLAEAGAAIHTGHDNCGVEALPDSSFHLHFRNGNRFAADRVILTAPSPVAAGLCPQLPDAERAAHAAIEYQGVICPSVLLRRPLNGYYVTNLMDQTLPFTGIIEMTALVDRECVGGHHLVYLPKYASAGDPEWGMPDEKLASLFVDGLVRVYPGLSPADVLAWRVSRDRFAFSLPTPGYSDRLPPMRSGISGLYVINSAHITDGTSNVNEAVRIADESFAWLVNEGIRPSSLSWQSDNSYSRWWMENRFSDSHAGREMRLFLGRAEAVIQPRPDDCVLDIGCGEGFLEEYLGPSVRWVTGLDISHNALNRARIRLKDRGNVMFSALDPVDYTLMDVVGNDRFSMVLCVSVVQYFRHMSELAALIRNVARLVEPGGRMLIADLPDETKRLTERFQWVADGIREGRFPDMIRFLFSAGMRQYLRGRRRTDILRFRKEELGKMLARLNIRGDILSETITPFSSRFHLFLRFP
jgi:protoporphyrinogen oxidase/SAM-dependent methyltransferase